MSTLSQKKLITNLFYFQCNYLFTLGWDLNWKESDLVKLQGAEYVSGEKKAPKPGG
jgi:hypothetical protein|tara:strand:- start:159 stop:326 length:168 start_codon:yes stop_codon:yes gene_type:complete